MKIQLGQWTIRTASSLKDKIIEAKKGGAMKSNHAIYWQLIGIYDTRIFGLVFYRNGEYDF